MRTYYIYISLYLYHGIKQDRLRVGDTTRRWSHSWSLLSIPAGAGHGKDQGLSLPTKTGGLEHFAIYWE